MFTCLIKIWDWLSFSNMDYKHAYMDRQGTSSNDLPDLEPFMRSNTGKLLEYPIDCPQPNSNTPYEIFRSTNHNQTMHYNELSENLIVRQQSPKLNEITEGNYRKTRTYSPINQAAVSTTTSPEKKTPITMQGWLYKQGNEGLKVWRKRWFVLSDNLCYYKGPEQGKILGSILLTSYKISRCGPEDKVCRKFVFKCEHPNMRTYYLSADSQDAMNNWIQVLSHASSLQLHTESDHQSGPSISSVYNTSTKDSGDSDYQLVNQQYATYNVYSGHNTPENVSNQRYSPEFCQCVQPLYVNAPPKPRRLIEPGYLSTSDFMNSKYSSTNSADIPNAKLINIVMPESAKHPHLDYAAMKYFQAPPEYSNTIPPHYIHNNKYSNTIPADHSNAKYSNSIAADFHKYANMTEIKNQYISTSRHPNPAHFNQVSYSYNLKPNHQKSHDHLLGSYIQPQVPPINNSQMIKYPQDNRQSDERRTPDIYGRSNTITKEISNYEDLYSDNVIYKRPFSPIPFEYATKPVVQQKAFAPIIYPMKNQYNSYNTEVYQRKQPSQIPRPHSADFLEVKNYNTYKHEIYNQSRPKSSLDISEDNYYYSKESYAEHMRKSALYLQQLPKNHYQTTENEHPVPTHHDQSLFHCFNRRQEMQCMMNFQRYNDHRKKHLMASMSGGSLDMNIDSNDKGSLSELIDGSVNVDREESLSRLLEWKNRMLPSPVNRNKIPSNYIQHQMNTKISDYNPRLTELPVQNNENLYSNNTRHLYNSLPHRGSYSSDDEASVSVSLTENETVQRAVGQHMWCSSPGGTNNMRNSDIYSESGFHMPQRNNDFNKQIDRQWNTSLNMSAGDLLGRTYEELVLLLIQLRRQSANNYHAIEAYYTKIDNLQHQQCSMDIKKLQKLEKLKRQVQELEKKYEKGKPLVNLVDNMVKLGTLYRSANDSISNPHVWNRLEFNQQVQEQRLLAEERKEWKRINSDHAELQSKIQQLYHFDKLLQEESNTLHCLQKDKQKIEKALSELRLHFNTRQPDNFGIEYVKKQQILLENELSKVYFMLAENSKKLEETVTGNAKLEQELLVLRQKLHLSRDQRSSRQFSNADDSLTCATGTSAMLETEFQKVQLLVADLQRQREELSIQVHQLTDRSRHLSQQVFPSNMSQPNLTDVMMNQKKPVTAYWRETDLDTMHGINHIKEPDYQNKFRVLRMIEPTDNLSDSDKYSNKENDERVMEFLQEKPDIKTVRIVKRENVRKQKDKEKYNYVPTENIHNKKKSVEHLVHASNNSLSSNYYNTSDENELLRNSKDNMIDLTQEDVKKFNLSLNFDHEPVRDDDFLFNKNTHSESTRTELPRNISEALSNNQAQNIKTGVERRVMPKEKKRRYTAPHNNFVLNSIDNKSSDEYTGLTPNRRRARDDLDMERALRQQIYTPDIVRSTLSHKEPKFNENTIDDLLGTPNKINIPERYVPEQLPQLSQEERQYRLRKIESIKKMLSDTTILSGTTSSIPPDNSKPDETKTTIVEEKRQREHLLQLNQILAKQVMEISKIVAGSNIPKAKQ